MTECFSPESEQQAAELVRWALSEGKTLSLRGTNTKQGFGVAVEADCELALERLTGIVEYHPEELVMQARPGTSLAEIEQALGQRRQRLEFEPPLLGRLYGMAGGSGAGGTIGGVFAGNLAGPRRFKAGGARDHILGVRAVNGRGETYKSGGKVIKNVSGYDLSKLAAGSWGTLSVLTELSFKVLPAPPASASLAVWGLSTADGVSLLTTFASSPCEPSGLAFLPGAALTAIHQDALTFAGDSLTIARLEGAKSSVKERTRSLKQLVPAGCQAEVLPPDASELCWSWIRDLAPLQALEACPVVLRAAIPPASAVAVAGFLDQLEGCVWHLDAAGNWLWAGLPQAAPADQLDALRREVAAAGGAVTLYRAPEAVKQRAGIYAFPDEAVKNLNEKIKNSFDPRHVFNPGRLRSTLLAPPTGMAGEGARRTRHAH